MKVHISAVAFCLVVRSDVRHPSGKRPGVSSLRSKPSRANSTGFEVATPGGTYFANADIRPLGFDDDVDFCRMLPERTGVVAIPLSAFLQEGGPRHMVRFAFAKAEATIDEAVRRLRRLRG